MEDVAKDARENQSFLNQQITIFEKKMKTQQLEINKLTLINEEKNTELAIAKKNKLDAEKMLEDAQMQLLKVKSEIIERDSQIE